MSERFNILWIDDQFDDMPGFIDDASLEGFDLKSFKTSREGMEYLRGHLAEVDAVILDAKVFSDNTLEVPSLKGLAASMHEIAILSGLNNRKSIPFVIYTGQPDLESDASFAEQMDGIGIPIFSKNQPNEPLFIKLRELIGDSPDASVRNRYRKAYEACGNGKINPQCWELLVPILRAIDLGADLPNEPYNDVRKSLEWVFRYLHAHSILHEKLIGPDGLVPLTLASIFLAGGVAEMKTPRQFLSCARPVFPMLIANSVRYVLDVTQPGSHTEEVETSKANKASIAEVAAAVPNHHLLHVVALMLVDLISWAAAYVRSNPDSGQNRALWNDCLQEGAALETHELECDVITEAKGSFFAKPKYPSKTGGLNVRIPKNLDGACRLKQNMWVRVSAKPNPNGSYWDASSVERLS